MSDAAPYVEVSVHHVIRVISRKPTDMHVEFESVDIGATQGTTLRIGSDIVAQYRPGTRHWSRAVKLATDLVREAYCKCTDADGAWTVEGMRRAMAVILMETGCLLWDGTDLGTDPFEEWK